MAVARAGICATLPARTSVLAAANPVGGRWTRAKTVQQNLGLSAPMLSRFDLIFVMRDAPDAALDQRLSEHVLALHSGEISPGRTAHNPPQTPGLRQFEASFHRVAFCMEAVFISPFADAFGWRCRAEACRSCPAARKISNAVSWMVQCTSLQLSRADYMDRNHPLYTRF